MTTSLKTRVREWVERNPFRIWRKSHALSMNNAAGLLGVGMWSVHGWEAGSYIPNPQNMAKIIEVTGIEDMRDRWAEWFEDGPKTEVGNGTK
jgi:hypothetical protein